MKIGVFSDVHGNLEALQACLLRLKQEGAQGYIYCGDFIGYGPDPEPCVEAILGLPLLACVLGNHDALLAQPELEVYFNAEARPSVVKKHPVLSENSIRSLIALPAVVTKPGFTVLHGSPRDPLKEYLVDCDQFRADYDLWKGKICFVGHTHIPFYIQGNKLDCALYTPGGEDSLIPLQTEQRYIINPGSVGRPRDRNPQASFGLWDTQAETFRFMRQEYNFRATQQKMRMRGFPPALIDTLALGL